MRLQAAPNTLRPFNSRTFDCFSYNEILHRFFGHADTRPYLAPGDVDDGTRPRIKNQLYGPHHYKRYNYLVPCAKLLNSDGYSHSYTIALHPNHDTLEEKELAKFVLKGEVVVRA